MKRDYAGAKRQKASFRLGKGQAGLSEPRRNLGQEGSLFPLMSLDSIYPGLRQRRREYQNQKFSVQQSRAVKYLASNKLVNNYSNSLLPAPQAGGRLVEFTSPFRVDLKHGEPASKLALHTEILKVDLSYFAIPKKDKRVFLKAKTKNITSAPILRGEAQIFMNGDLVSKSDLTTVSEGGYFDIDLGVDPNVETKRIVDKKSSKEGIFAKDQITVVTIELNVVNHHKFAIDLEIRDHYPISSHEDVKVEFIKVEPEAKSKKYGIVIWGKKIPAKKTQKFTFTYKVTHPNDYLVSEFN